MIAPEVVWVLGGSCVIGSVCAQLSWTALQLHARLAAQESLSSPNAFFFSYNITIFFGVSAVAGVLYG